MSEDLERRIEPERFAWPSADLDAVDRMRALAAGLPHAALDDTVFDADFDRVWGFIADLERSTPQYEASVSQLSILSREGERLELDSATPFGTSMRFRAILRPGWCVMASSSGAIGMAARPESEHTTRFVHFECAHVASRLLRPYLRWNIHRDFKKLRRIFEAELDIA